MGNTAERMEHPSLMEYFKVHEHFCRVLLDAYAVIDSNGKIVKCNQLFAQLTGMKTKQLLKLESIDDILQFSVAGEKMLAADFLQSTTPTRYDEVGCDTKLRSDLVLIVGIYPFIAAGSVIGSLLLLRDVTAEVNLQGKYKDKATQSITDPLTGLLNRNYFESFIQNQTEAIKQVPEGSDQRDMSIIMLDIDHFKKINDVYGHQAGDHILQEVAGIMKSRCRKTDVICRYGGEEFIAILPATSIRGAVRVADKIRDAIQLHKYDFEGKSIKVTISSGVAQYRLDGESFNETIARADEALYFSKESGRNRVSFHDGASLNGNF